MEVDLEKWLKPAEYFRKVHAGHIDILLSDIIKSSGEKFEKKIVEYFIEHE
jgi:hypothetical protein